VGGVVHNLLNLPANEKQGSVPDESFQVLLTNEKQGKLSTVKTRQPHSAIARKIYMLC
jgi:hypothetical protein